MWPLGWEGLYAQGDFWVTNEVKIMLARMLLDYEVRLFKKSSRPGVVYFGFEKFE